MTYFAIQYGLAMLCGMIAAWRIYIPYDTIARIAFGASMGFFLSIWTGLIFLKG